MKAVAAAVSLSFLYCLPAASQVSATASPVSNSSGSVVNQAVQIVPGQYMKHSYGSQIQCDSATLNISPFVSSTHSFGKPNNEYYQEPVYDNSDNFGLINPETGLDGPDGIPDNPGTVLYYKPQRTGYRQNYSNNFGITATFSVPLDSRPLKECLRAARSQNQLYEQALADKRLNYEMGRLKACATALREGYGFKQDSPFFPICADVVLKPKPVEGHTHQITYPKPVLDREWLDFGDAAPPAAAVSIPVLPYGQVSD
nr:gp165 [uncultured Mediterranean phage uvMED]